MESSTIQHILFVAAAVVFAFACRTSENRYIAKLGAIAMLGALYLAGYYITDEQHAGGALFVGGWFLVPWMEIMFRVRRLRFPIKSEVVHRFPPSRDVFPDLGELSREAEDAGFVQVGDTGWMWSETEHFMRLFYHEEKRAQASVALARQGEMGFSYVSLTTRGKNGVVYTTTNYPFPTTMKHPPKHLVNRYEDAESFEDLLADHGDFLEALAVTTMVGASLLRLTTGVSVPLPVSVPSVTVRLIAGRLPPALTCAAPAAVSTTWPPDSA